MWNRISGNSNDKKSDMPSEATRRNETEGSTTHRSAATVSSNSNKKSSSRNDDRDQGFNPNSKSYSFTSRSKFPGTASASVGFSYETLPGLVRNASLAGQMPKSRLERDERDENEDQYTRSERRREHSEGEHRERSERSRSRDREGERRKRRSKRENKDKDRDQDWGLSKSEIGFSEGSETSKALGPNSDTIDHSAAISSHVQDQFPGQFPTQSTAPYRPPLAASEGGPGLAAEYYGDTGESVAEQPGNRTNTPSLIIGAEPHLQPASSVAAPPPEPSASGEVGAAASFFSGSFDTEDDSSHSQQHSSTYTPGPSRLDSSYHSSSAPAIPTIGSAAMGAAAGYLMGSQTSSHQQRLDHASSVGVTQSEYSSSTHQRPPHQAQNSHYSNNAAPPSRPSKHSSQSSKLPAYATGAAGLAAAAFEHNHHPSFHHSSSRPQYPATSMAQRYRHHGPLSAFVEFFKDPEGVAQFEEYSEIIGVCRYCFAPGSSPRDAPRKHFYGRRRSNERFGSSNRVDKDNRYYSSENESRRKNEKSWLATGLAGYGLGKVGESLFKQKNDFDDTYSVKTGRYFPEESSRTTRRFTEKKTRHRSRSKETGIKEDGRVYRNSLATTKSSTRRHSRSRSGSKDRNSGITEAAFGAAIGSSVAASSAQRQSRSPDGSSVKIKHKTRENSSERRQKSRKKKEKGKKGFFSFGFGSSSSSSVDLAYTSDRDNHRSSTQPKPKSKDKKKAEAALIGLGAAAAALTLNDGRPGRKTKGVKELVGVKETKEKYDRGSRYSHRPTNSSKNSEEELWESAPEDDLKSLNSDLAYGASRRGSRESLSSESPGTDKWGWRWGSKKRRRESSSPQKSSDHSSFPNIASTAGAGIASAAMMSPDQHQRSAMESSSSIPLQHVYPVPTSDPSRFDVGSEGSVVSSSRPATVPRPEAIPIQHPQPIAPVSTALYSDQGTYDHSYSAPTGPRVFSQTSYQYRPAAANLRSGMPERGISGSFSRNGQSPKDTIRDSKLRRRDSSPASSGADPASTSTASHRRASAKDDSTAVRFAVSEEQEESDRLERRRKRKEDKERREAEEQEQDERERQRSKDSSSKNFDAKKRRKKESPEKSPDRSWAAPAAAGAVGAAIGAIAALERPKLEETREERRERRRKEREREDEEDRISRKERRRREKEREEQEKGTNRRGREHDEEANTYQEPQRLPDEVSDAREDPDRHGPSGEKDSSVFQEATSAKRRSSHEDYGTFFNPTELLNRSNDPVKITSANADADIDLGQIPATIVEVEPKRVRDLSASPAFSPADTDDKIDPSRLSFPWQVPKLRLIEATPPPSRGSTPIIRPKGARDEDIAEPPREVLPPKISWEADQNHEYTAVTPKEDREEFTESTPGENSDKDQANVSRPSNDSNLAKDEEQRDPPSIDTSTGNGPASSDDDIKFAATLAASAEDAGFDPSIVTNDPSYRRRETPSGSKEHSMPGGFEDDDEPRFSKKARKKKDKASRSQSQPDVSKGQDDDAVAQDHINQEEDFDPRASQQKSVDNVDGEWESTKKSKSEKSRKVRKETEFEDKFFETSESASKPPDSKSREVYDSPTEDATSIAASTTIGNDRRNGKKSRKKSKRDSTFFEDAASTISLPSTNEASNDFKSEPKDERSGILWDRVLGKSTDSLPQENGARVITNGAADEGFEEPKKKSRKSEEWRSTRDEVDDEHATSRSSTAADRERNQWSRGAQDSGRITQDLPAKV